MSGLCRNALRLYTSFFGFVFDLMGDGLRFLFLTVRSHSALSAEVLFLRKQLAWVRHDNQGRPHSSLGPGIPEPLQMWLPLQPHSRSRHFTTRNCKVAARAIFGSLHHEYRWERSAA